ncbi:G/U mismatch-specific DNA glycosylase [Fodinicola feengrottensis]|uniref:G/U mismatch-specific DNA glycosylase n=1 Tax=Fodinicola feengrottensis TaxID=435914 RepID=A0ABN2IVZ3_9ACTN
MTVDRRALADAYGRTIPDVIDAGLKVLFVGINPGLYSAATGRHFARPGNRFWPALHRGGFTDRQLHPSEQQELLAYGLGITNVVARATARADELRPDEFVAGAQMLAAKAADFGPQWIALVGITAYRTGWRQPKAVIGEQPVGIGPSALWVLPNPSGLNAHYTPDSLAAEFAKLRERIG